MTIINTESVASRLDTIKQDIKDIRNLIEHPEFKTITKDEKPMKRGLVCALVLITGIIIAAIVLNKKLNNNG